MYASGNRDDFRSCSDMHSYDTRRRDDVYVQYCRLGIAQRGPVRTCQVLFNKLPTSMRLLALERLKSEFKRYLTRKAFYSVDEFLGHDFTVSY